MKYPLLLIFCLLGWQSVGFTQILPGPTGPKRPTVTVSGYIREAGSQEALIGVNAYVAAATPGARPIGTTSNTYGFYSLTLPTADSVMLTFSFVGYTTTGRTVSLRNSHTLNIDLGQGVVGSGRDANGNPFAEPVLVPTNIQGGLGCFTAYNRTTLALKVK